MPSSFIASVDEGDGEGGVTVVMSFSVSDEAEDFREVIISYDDDDGFF